MHKLVHKHFTIYKFYLMISYKCYLMISYKCYLTISYKCYLMISYKCYLMISYKCYLMISYKCYLMISYKCYLMIIAFTLIIASRHSSKLQRLTANRVLKVLATLFLLSYTKTLLTVCQVLFYFSSVTHLPSEHSTLIWSVDTGVELFGAKVCFLYV